MPGIKKKFLSTDKENKPASAGSFKTFDLFAGILTGGVVLFFFYFFLLTRYGEFIPNTVTNLLFTAKDKYMDFFNPILYARDMKPYTMMPGNDSPLFLYVIHYIAGLFPASAGSPFDFRYTLQGRMLFTGYIFISLALFAYAFNELFKSLKIDLKRRAWFFTAFVLSYPVIFAIDRGNYVLLTAAFISFFMVKFVKGKYMSAAVLLAVAIALKYYPAVFGIMFLINKKWKEALVCAAVSCFLLLFCMGQFQGGMLLNLNMLVKNLAYYQSAGTGAFAELAGHNTSIYMLFDIPVAYLYRHNHGQSNDIFMAINSVVKYAAYLVLAVTIFLACLPKMKIHDRFLLLSAGLLLFPLKAGDYMIPMIIIPSILWIISEPGDRVMPWLAGSYFICKRYIALYNAVDVSITIQSVLNPLLLLMIMVYIIIRSPYLKEWLAGTLRPVKIIRGLKKT